MQKAEQPRTAPNPEERFKKMDKNADGKITADEFPNKETFDRIDADKDGAVTLEEMKAFMAKDQPREKPKDQPKDQPKEQPREVKN